MNGILSLICHPCSIWGKQTFIHISPRKLIQHTEHIIHQYSFPSVFKIPTLSQHPFPEVWLRLFMELTHKQFSFTPTDPSSRGWRKLTCIQTTCSSPLNWGIWSSSIHNFMFIHVSGLLLPFCLLAEVDVCVYS